MKFFTNKEKWNRSIFTIFPALFLSFTFFVFGPLEIYLTNTASFWFQISMLLPGVCISFLIAFILLGIISFLFKDNHIFISFIFGVSLAMYVQGNWTFIDYGEMDGTAIDWGTYGTWSYVNTIIWVCIIFLPVVISLFIQNKSSYKKVLQYLSLGMICIQCITLITLFLTTDISQDNKDYYVARDDQMLTLSENHNVIVMMFDAFQASYFQQAIDDIPESKETFDGFIFFDSAAGTSLFSQEGGATILTGEQLRVDLPFGENIDYIYNESKFFPALNQNNYDVRYYETTAMVSSDMAGTIKNIVLEESKPTSLFDLTRTICQITAFRYMPHIIKKSFWFSYTDIENLKQNDNNSVSEFLPADNVFNQYVLDGKINVVQSDNIYRMYYFQGVHPPYRIDENGNSIEYTEESYVVDYVIDIHENEMLYRQALGSVRIMMNFIEALKEEGIYDKTDIVITADHGWENRYNPLLLIKTTSSTGELETSHAPISYIEDFGPTIMSLIDSGYQEAKTVFDYTEGEDRERIFYRYDINADRSYNARNIYVLYDSEPIRSNFGLLSPEGRKYTVGDNIVFSEENDGSRYFLSGLYDIDIDTSSVWSLGNTGQMCLELGAVQTDLTATIKLVSVYGGSQHVIIKNREEVLYDGTVESTNPEISFYIPEHCIDEGNLVLDFEFPDACSPASRNESNDTRILAVKFYEIRFTEATQ